MLTTYASCWGSFVLRGATLAVAGAAVVAAPRAAPVLAGAAVAVLAAGAANATSVALRMRRAHAAWPIAAAEAAALAVLAAAILAGAGESLHTLAYGTAALALASGASQAVAARRMPSARRHASPLQAAALGSAFGALLAVAAHLSGTTAAAPAAAGVLAALACIGLGAGYAWVGLRLRGVARAARHELLRDAPLAFRPPMQRTAPGAPGGRLTSQPARAPA